MSTVSRRRAAACVTTALLTAAAALASCGDNSFGSAGADASSDAPSEGASNDAAAPADAGGRFCDTVPDATFCADFDVTGQPLTAGWTGLDFPAAATSSLDRDTWVSPPASADLSVSYIVAGYPFARLKKTFPTHGFQVQLDLDVLLGDLPAGSTVTPFVIRFGPPDDGTYNYELGMQITPAGIVMFDKSYFYLDGAAPTMSGTSFPYQADAITGWAHFEVQASLDFDAGAGANFVVGSGSTKSMKLFTSPELLAPPMTIMVGGVESYLSDAGTLDVHVDNVVVRAY